LSDKDTFNKVFRKPAQMMMDIAEEIADGTFAFPNVGVRILGQTKNADDALIRQILNQDGKINAAVQVTVMDLQATLIIYVVYNPENPSNAFNIERVVSFSGRIPPQLTANIKTAFEPKLNKLAINEAIYDEL
jgi:hypothetical protein